MAVERISITGYERDSHCDHCGRKLVHGIKVSGGRVVGATCFNERLTKPRVYQGKPYRIGTENVIRYARIVELGTMHRHGVTPDQLVFEASEEWDGQPMLAISK